MFSFFIFFKHPNLTQLKFDSKNDLVWTTQHQTDIFKTMSLSAIEFCTRLSQWPQMTLGLHDLSTSGSLEILIVNLLTFEGWSSNLFAIDVHLYWIAHGIIMRESRECFQKYSNVQASFWEIVCSDYMKDIYLKKWIF